MLLDTFTESLWPHLSVTNKTKQNYQGAYRRYVKGPIGVTDVFLRINGYRFDCDGATVFAEMMRMFDEKDFKFPSVDKFSRSIVVQK